MRRPAVAAVARRRGRGSGAAVAAGIVAGLLAACSFEYPEAAASADELPEHVPETELTDVTRTIVRDGRVVAQITARQVWNFRRRARTILDDVRYAEYDAAGNVVVSGSAERAVYYTEREDAVLSGSVRLRSEPQGASLQAQVLRWDDDRRRLATGATDTVELTRDDGSRLSGGGLVVDVRTRTIRCSVTGSLVAAAEPKP